jgi:hypothetical protein
VSLIVAYTAPALAVIAIGGLLVLLSPWFGEPGDFVGGGDG